MFPTRDRRIGWCYDGYRALGLVSYVRVDGRKPVLKTSSSIGLARGFLANHRATAGLQTHYSASASCSTTVRFDCCQRQMALYVLVSDDLVRIFAPVAEPEEARQVEVYYLQDCPAGFVVIRSAL